MRNTARPGVWATCVCVLMLAHASLSAGSPLPTPWVNQDIGPVGLPGSASNVSGVFTVSGAGADIWGTSDAFQAVMQPITGDAQIIARVTAVQNTNTYAKAGIMLRGSLTAGSADVILDLRPNGAIEFMTRSVNGGSTSWPTGGTQAAPAWLKLTRVGTTVTGFVSSNGTAWTAVGSTTLSVPAAAYVGLAVTSHDVTKLNTSTFDNVSVSASSTNALPSPWTNQDVGQVGLAGSATYASGVFTVKGAGADIWGTADAFQAVSQPLAGDVQLVARVTSVQNTNTYAKAGIMLRDSTAAGAAHVMLDVRPTGDIEFMSRSVTGGSTSWPSGGTQGAPVWLKLTRAGSVVTGYVSTTGTSWTAVGTASLTYGATPIAALVVTSHDTTQLNTSTFDNDSAGALPVVTPPPSAPSTPLPSSGATDISTPSATLTWTAAGATSYDVLLGTTNPPAQVASGLSSANYAVSALQQGVTYYWQVIAKNSGGSTAGPVWSFSTVAPPPPPPQPITTTGSAPTSYSAITDRLARAKPALPSIGSAGYTFTDPAFGSTIVRITDGNTRPSSANVSFRTPSAGPQAAWGAGSNYFFVTSTDGTIVPFSFDASTMTASRIPGSGDGGLTLNFYVEPEFSATKPSVIYGISAGGDLRTVYQYDFSANAYSPIIDLDTVVPGLTGYVGGLMTGGSTTEYLSVFFGGGSQDQHHYILWSPTDNLAAKKIVDTLTSTINGVPTNITLNFKLHAMSLDRSGRYVFIHPTAPDLASPRYASQTYIWDTATDIITAITSGGSDGQPNALPGGHGAPGWGYGVNHDCCTYSAWDGAQWQFRSLASPLVTSDMVSPLLTPKEVYLSDHATWINSTEANPLVPIIIATYRYGDNTAPWRAWDDEIIAMETDIQPAPTVWRFAHHRSNIGSDTDPTVQYFWYEPRPSVSPDGRWVIFTSNWEKTLGADPRDGGHARQDVFLLKLQ